MTDNTTNNVVTTTPVGITPFTVDVTAANLMPDLSVKDFVVVINGAINPNVNWTKTSRTILTYTGAAFSSVLPLEVRRKTPEVRFQHITFGNKFNSAIYEEELNRISRRAYEYSLNGVGAAFSGVSYVPANEPYGVTWATDTTQPPTRQAVYNKIETLAPINNPTFTGTVTVPTIPDADVSTRAVNSSWVNTRIGNVLINSPVLGGNPVATNQPITDYSNRIATTRFVKDWYASRCEVVLVKNDWTVPDGIGVTVTGITEVFDSSNNWASNTFTAPSTGTYEVVLNVHINCTGGTGLTTISTTADVFINGLSEALLYQKYYQPSTQRVTEYARVLISLNANDTFQFRQFVDIDGSGYTINIVHWAATIKRINSPA